MLGWLGLAASIALLGIAFWLYCTGDDSDGLQ